MTVAVERRFECHPILVDERQSFLARRDHVVRFHAGHVHRQRLLESGSQRQHLESAGIGERRPVPVHESRESAGRVEHILARALEQMKRVGQQTLRPQLAHGLRQDGLHCRLRGDRHEGRRADVAVRRVDDAGAAVTASATAFAVS